MRDLILTGFMGTGKTAVGSLVAERLSLEFLDLDEEIERRTGRSIADIFDAEGEESFRALERSLLAELQQGGGRLVATGGGTLMAEESRALLRDDQPVLCLTCDLPELLQRLGSGERRPLLAGRSAGEVEELLERRAPVYDLFERIDTTGRTPQEVASAIASRFVAEEIGRIPFARHAESAIVAGPGSIQSVGRLLHEEAARGIAIVVTDENIARAGWAAAVERSLESAGYRVHCVEVPPGEGQKSLAGLERLYVACVEAGLDRAGTIVGVGGGVIGDLAGMLAATYMRGVRLVLVPTSLLAQVDAAIGGKVAIDLAAGKNLVGAFYPPALTVADPRVLRSLGTSHLSQGLAEMIKIAAIGSAALLDGLLALREPTNILMRSDLIRAAIALKADIVRADPYESGDRMLLNFGHTVGHAVEAASAFSLAHGEAVSIGMQAELRVAVEEGWSDGELFDSLSDFLSRMDLPRRASNLCEDDVQKWMRLDKKRVDQGFRLAVPTAAGRGEVIEVDDSVARRAARYALGEN